MEEEPTNPIGKVYANDFRIDEFIAAGGMGIVYRGTQLSLERTVCIKVPIASDNTAIRDYFEREAKELSKCNHPNVVEVYGATQTSEDPFIAMAWIEWPTLNDLILGRRPFSPLAALRITQKLLKALAEIYTKTKILHRDIKPSNIFCSGDDVKLADFGLAKAIATNPQAQDAASRGMGTWAYMAPEIFFAEPATVSSDLYALGCTLHEMLSHTRAFPGDDCYSDVEWEDHHKSHTPLLLAGHSAYPQIVINFLDKLLKPNRGERYILHDEAMTDLETIVKELEAREPDLTWYLARAEATADMCERWCRYPLITLVGVSHENLHKYIVTTLRGGGQLPWKRLSIFFADDHSGHAWEKAAYPKNMRLHRQLICYELLKKEAAHVLPSLESVDFYQREAPTGWTGALLEGPEANKFVAYVVLSNIPHISDLRQAATFRLSSKSLAQTRHAQLLDNIVRQSKMLSQVSVSLGSYRRSVWDLSAEEWDRYCREGLAYQESVRKMAEIARISPGEEILDVGCGSGALTRELLISGTPELRVTLLDASPGMLNRAKQNISQIQTDNIDYALCRVPSVDGRDDIDLLTQNARKKKFDRIFLHFMLPSVCQPMDDFDALANWCLPYLKKDGEVVISARNTSVEIPRLPNWTHWEDQFRPALEAKFQDDLDGPRCIRSFSKQSSLPSKEYVAAAFARSRFKLQTHEVHYHPLHAKERRLMWLCPAVLDSMVDVLAFGIPKAQSFVQECYDALNQKETLPMSVAYWVFKLE